MIYTNSFLATLNARKAITGQIDDVSHMLVSIPPKISTTQQSSSIGNRSQAQAISIRIETTREQHGVASSGTSVCFVAWFSLCLTNYGRDFKRTRSQSKLIDKDLYDEDMVCSVF
ncbi:hypothetical protein C0993_005198 [Termitomyces sp. T159_Od127]|nr:hypothetical protein C0993_005198 [Termitomyces sp. T159_Od127]